ncbi:transmembrane protein 255B isoform 2-T2 [Hipposideros larvatus]
MQQPALPVPGPLALLDTTGFVRRKKISLWFVGSLLVLSIFILTIGLTATTRTENVTVGGYYPGIILGFGSFLGIIGINLVENRRQMLVAAIVFISFGVVAAFCCAIVDGVFAARHLETRPLTSGRCQFYSSGVGYLHDVYQTEVTCHSLNGKCQLKVKSNTCYCCDLYNCQSTEYSPMYYEFVGVSSCRDVLHLYRLLWASTVLNVLGLLLGIVTAAVLGAFKDMENTSQLGLAREESPSGPLPEGPLCSKLDMLMQCTEGTSCNKSSFIHRVPQIPLSQLAYGTSAPPQILYNPAHHILAYAGFGPAPTNLPTSSSYPLPLQPSSSFPASPSTDLSLSEDAQPPSQSSSSFGLPPNASPLYAPAPFLPGEKPPPYAP